MWDLWWKKWHWDRFSPSTSVSPGSSHSTDSATFIIYHPGLVQQANYWKTYQVDSLTPHPKKKSTIQNIVMALNIQSKVSVLNDIRNQRPVE
jgi:hypothetical protein